MGLGLGIEIGLGSVTPTEVTIPGTLADGDWSIEDAGTGGSADVTVSTPPSDGGSAFTDLEYKIDGDIWRTSGGTAPTFNIPSGFTDGVATNVRLRYVNAVGNALQSNQEPVTTS